MKINPLIQLGMIGQSVWLDYIKRDLIASGELRRLINEDGLRGMTSNPSIFEKAITGSQEYEKDIHDLTLKGKKVIEIYESLSQKDVGNAADEFRRVYDETGGDDGFVSLEVNPHLAHDTEGTIAEARRFWSALDRPNILIKIPATKEGLSAIHTLISEGLNINVTLLFGVSRYREVIEAYLTGLEERLSLKKPLQHVRSVASFFVSRIDSLVDPQIEKLITKKGEQDDLAEETYGQVAIISAKKAYQIYRENFGGSRFRRLAQNGAHAQKLLWASTGTKNPNYSDIKYIDSLIGENTVNTIPIETMNAYRDHGDPRPRIELDIYQANLIFQQLPKLGIDLDQVAQQLEEEGVRKFCEPFDKLLATLEKQRAKEEKTCRLE